MGSRKRQRVRRVSDQASQGPPVVSPEPRVVRVGTWPETFRAAVSWLVPMGIAALASQVWWQSGVLAAVGVSVLGGAAYALIVPGRPKRADARPSPQGMIAAMGIGCFWITAASAFLLAALMRTVGIPFLEAAVPCYVVVIGSNALFGFLRGEWRGRKALSRR